MSRAVAIKIVNGKTFTQFFFSFFPPSLCNYKLQPFGLVMHTLARAPWACTGCHQLCCVCAFFPAFFSRFYFFLHFICDSTTLLIPVFLLDLTQAICMWALYALRQRRRRDIWLHGQKARQPVADLDALFRQVKTIIFKRYNGVYIFLMLSH